MQTEFETSISPTSGKDARVTFDADAAKYRQRKRALILRNQSRDNTSLGSDEIGTGTDRPAPEEVGIRPLRLPQSHVRVAPREITLQEWEGRVLHTQGRLVIARLVDITAGDTEETEEVELPLDDVTEADQALLRPGAIFRWILGYSYASGRKERFARVIVRRLPVWTAREMSEADREASELHDAIFGASEDRAASAG